MTTTKPRKLCKNLVHTLFELSTEDWVAAGLPRPTDVEFFAVLEALQERYDNRWEQDFKEVTTWFKALTLLQKKVGEV